MPPFKPQINEDLSKYFNVKQDEQSIADTYIPRENRKIVAANVNAFSNFNSSKAKKK